MKLLIAIPTVCNVKTDTFLSIYNLEIPQCITEKELKFFTTNKS